jgi:hypothetical protein
MAASKQSHVPPATLPTAPTNQACSNRAIQLARMKSIAPPHTLFAGNATIPRWWRALKEVGPRISVPRKIISIEYTSLNFAMGGHVIYATNRMHPIGRIFCASGCDSANGMRHSGMRPWQMEGAVKHHATGIRSIIARTTSAHQQSLVRWFSFCARAMSARFWMFKAGARERRVSSERINFLTPYVYSWISQTRCCDGLRSIFSNHRAG